ncbi:hypothetical protein [Sphingomonas sp. BAUL-RG-20F-R05-02]|uniref:hypothetical protein n=1 Tax=Sphingomonas sp. BAUL-RG-20F-R05-02 TaxID=2914830 RepID=UPI001F59B186|nr:hypothetical protein [Sphingomonas sp. BAUL-RG-20F-R05-02]
MTRERLWPVVLAGWALAAAVLVLVSARAIAHLWFPDPDDAMRLAQVRDWLGGQSWWDVSQRRLWDGHFAMHWSRLVDLPLALMMVLLDPVFGQALSTRITATTVPLLTLLAVMALGAELTRRLSGMEQAKSAVLLAPLSVPLLYQLRPLRIDHHGWQIAFALLAVVALVGRPDRRSGAVMGLALAVLLTISLEGLPVTAAILGVAMLAGALVPARREQALVAIWTLAGLTLLLHVATRGPAMFSPACDAIAPAWIAALAIAAIGSTVPMLPYRMPLIVRLVMLAAAGGAALATLAAISPQCLRGPFAGLDPFVRRFWYENVAEGLPVWKQVPSWAAMTVGFPITGLIGGVLAWRASTGEARIRWTMLLALAASTFALSLLVIRTGATANALALPGGAWALHAMLTRARAVRMLPKRIAATAGALLAATPGLAAAALFGFAPAATVRGAPSAALTRPPCDGLHEIADLAALPTARLFAPVDITPQILATTTHSAIAGGYHRNLAAIERAMATFMADPATAHRWVLESGASYVVGCPGPNETEMYKQFAPNGFWARLERGDTFPWLRPVVIRNSPVLVWKVVR